MARLASALLSITFAAALAACSSSSAAPDAGTASSGQSGQNGEGGDLIDAAQLDDGSDSLCASDPRAETFTPGLTAKGMGGVLTAHLDTASPSTPSKGNNEWTVEISDAGGAPVDGLHVVVKPFMPDHGHGSSITPVVTPMGSGKYDLRFNLFMPGIWTITLTLTTPPDAGASLADTAVYSFCIHG